MMREVEVRLKFLKQSLEKFNGKRIALYGTADNANAILRNFPEQNVMALIDQQHTGEYIFGKKVISLDEAVQLGIEVVIIAAEAVSSQIVSERIFSFCQANRIRLLNMYGMEEKDIRHQLFSQEISYMEFTEEEMFRQVLQNEVICFQLMDVLCASRYFEEEDFLKELERHCEIHQMTKRRIRAEEMVDHKSAYGINHIYKNYQFITSAAKEEVQYLQLQEEQFFCEGIIPRVKMIDMLNRAYQNGKKIYVVSQLRYSEEAVKALLKKIGVSGYHGIIQENLLNITVSNGELRRGLAESFDQRVLYIGTKQSCNVMLAQIYHMDVRIVKDAWELLWQISDLHIKKTDVPVEKRTAFSEWVQRTMNSPFVKDNQNYIKQAVGLAGKLGSRLNLHGNIGNHLDLLPLPQYSSIQDLEILEFPECKEPVVSIVIPVYNQFQYTYNCLKSVLYNSGDVKYEVIIADDGSTDDTAQIERVVEGVKILHNKENLLFLRNCNQAAHHAEGKYLLFLNNDTQVRCNWMNTLVHLLERCPDAGMAGSKLICPDGTLQEAGGIIWQDGTGANYGRGDNPDAPEYNYVKEVDYISGASIIIHKELWDEIGGFDERYVPAYCEDSDLAFEVRKRGRKVLYQPASEVVHFEGISNGKDTGSGVKSHQIVNAEKLKQKWETVLSREHCRKEEGSFRARERKQSRKTIVVFSEVTPRYDYDAGSKTIYSYLKLFLEKGYLVKFVPTDFKNLVPYTCELQQMGIEILYGDYYKKYIDMWILENKEAIEYAFINFPSCGKKFLDILRCTSIKTRYYGHDLHFMRKQREYELTGDLQSLEMSKTLYRMEKDTIAKAEQVYYPSKAEVQIVKEKFKKEEVKQLQPYIYGPSRDEEEYVPETREGMLFVGGYNHPPNVDAVLWFAKEIYPHVCKQQQIPFYIIGSNETIEIQNIKTRGITHMGYLTESELNEMYRKVRLVVVPLRYGAGVKGKVIDAMYHGVPMVSTSIGIEGIAEAEKYIETADTPEIFVEKILTLYEDMDTLINTSACYRKIIGKYYSPQAAWERIKNDF